MSTTHAGLVHRYLEMWNATEGAARRELISQTLTDDAVYVDPMAKAAGAEAIDGLIAAVQGQFPGHRFRLHSGPDAHHDRVRFRWALAPDGGEPVAIGLDVAELADDGRMVTVTGFLDPVG